MREETIKIKPTVHGDLCRDWMIINLSINGVELLIIVLSPLKVKLNTQKKNTDCTHAFVNGRSYFSDCYFAIQERSKKWCQFSVILPNAVIFGNFTKFEFFGTFTSPVRFPLGSVSREAFPATGVSLLLQLESLVSPSPRSTPFISGA